MYTERTPKWPIAAVIILIVLFSADAQAQTTLIDFEDADIPVDSLLRSQYANKGVLFDDGQVVKDAAAHSGQRVVRAIPIGSEVYDLRPFVIHFTGQNVTRVKLFAGAFESMPGKLTAFDADSGGNIVAAVTHFVPQNTFSTAFEVTVASGNIQRVELQLEHSSYVLIDDLEFNGSAGPMPTQPPIVQLTQPVNNTDIDVPSDPKIDIAGTVTGEGLLQNVRVTVDSKRPPDSTAAPLRLALSLTGSGTTRQFSLAGGMSPLPLGPVTVTATAENIAALKGTTTSVFTNLPRSMRDKFGELGGTNTFGEFQYGLLKDCAIAVYERGAISGSPAGAFAIRGDIFTKWLSLRGGFNEYGWFGCPKADEGTTVKDAHFQTFERGRIYSNLPGTPTPPPVYVPAVFVEAIDKRGGDPGVGLPLADPTDSAGPMQTWLFQRFDRPDDEEWILPSTLEIRGNPPRLYLERQIGAWMEGVALDKGVFALSDFDRERNKTPATLWESFDCKDEQGNNDKRLGPCPVSPEPPYPPPIAPEDKPDFKNKFCHGSRYIPASPWGPPEWKAVRGQYDATPVFGLAISGAMTNIDNGLTHRTHNGNCPYLGSHLGIGSVLLGETPIGAFVLAEEYGATCVSDYEFFVRTLGPQIDTRPELPSLFSDDHPDRIKAEYEVAYAAAAHNFLGNPGKGDLIHMTGRWIVDCGHAPFKTELHPLFSFARMKTVISETNPFTQGEEDLFGKKPATRVGIWVNGWYPGGDNGTNAIEFDIYPPPRPSPNAKLRIVKPVDNGPGGYRAAVDVNVEEFIRPIGAATYVRLRFTALRRQNPVTRDGEMLFGYGRQYWGIWYLYWAE